MSQGDPSSTFIPSFVLRGICGGSSRGEFWFVLSVLLEHVLTYLLSCILDPDLFVFSLVTFQISLDVGLVFSVSSLF